MTEAECEITNKISDKTIICEVCYKPIRSGDKYREVKSDDNLKTNSHIFCD